MINNLQTIKLINTFLFLIIIICEISSAEVPRPRGVSLSRVSLYDPTKDFTCFDQSLKIPFTQVNDDYCDCPDASDEPGTSACAHGIFHCTNAGHKPLNLASSRVNDGICDCCDATDEYISNKCINNCKELGRSAREDALKKAELLKAGKQIRTELSEKGIKLKQEKKDKLIELQKQKVEAELVLKEKEEIKKEVEELENGALEYYRQLEAAEKQKRDEAEAAKTQIEATETFNKFDSNQNGYVDVSELQTRQTFDRDRNGEVSEEEAKYFLNEKDMVDLEEFIIDCWSKIKPFEMADAGLFKGPAGEGTVEEVPMYNNEEPEDEEEEDEETRPVEEDDQEAEEETQEEHEEEPKEAQVEEPPKIEYDDDTQNLVNQATQARNEFSEAQSSVGAIQSEITNIEEYLQKDFGPDEAYAALEGNCFEYTDYEYIYSICPFDKVSQQQKSSSSETRLGVWGHWAGPDHNKYETMLYDKGQSCWNGPQRTTAVKISCGSENKLTAVSEPNRCEYLFKFTTPAACVEISDDHTDDVHDEL